MPAARAGAEAAPSRASRSRDGRTARRPGSSPASARLTRATAASWDALDLAGAMALAGPAERPGPQPARDERGDDGAYVAARGGRLWRLAAPRARGRPVDG